MQETLWIGSYKREPLTTRDRRSNIFLA